MKLLIFFLLWQQIISTKVSLEENADDIRFIHEKLKSQMINTISEESDIITVKSDIKPMATAANYKKLYVNSFSQAGCEGDLIMGDAVNLNKCFIQYAGGNASQPVGSTKRTCDGKTVKILSYKNLVCSGALTSTSEMTMGCRDFAQGRRLQESDDDEFRPWLSMSYSCSTDATLNYPSGGSFMVENSYDADNCDDPNNLSEQNYIKENYCIQMSTGGSFINAIQYSFPFVSGYSDVNCEQLLTQMEESQTCSYTEPDWDDSAPAETASSYWTQGAAPTDAPTAPPSDVPSEAPSAPPSESPTIKPSNAAKVNYHHANPTTSPGLVALYFFASLFGGVLVGASATLLYYIMISKNKEFHKTVVYSMTPLGSKSLKYSNPAEEHHSHAHCDEEGLGNTKVNPLSDHTA